MKFIELKPLDTLFFRGNIPMEAGILSEQTVFPPPVSVVRGALWTESCREKAEKENSSKVDYSLTNDKFPFDVKSIFLKKADKYYVPVPATWFAEEKTVKIADDYTKSLEELGVQCSKSEIPYAFGKKDLKPFKNSWVSVDFLKSEEIEFKDDDIISGEKIYSSENRTGVALTLDRKAKDGQLYSSVHIRLNDDVSIVVGIDGELDLEKSGILQLGGEKRMVKYSLIEENPFENLPSDSSNWLSLVSIEADEKNVGKIKAAPKFRIASGWDLVKKFHKDSVSLISAGAVFSENINGQCIALPTKKAN